MLPPALSCRPCKLLHRGEREILRRVRVVSGTAYMDNGAAYGCKGAAYGRRGTTYSGRGVPCALANAWALRFSCQICWGCKDPNGAEECTRGLSTCQCLLIFTTTKFSPSSDIACQSTTCPWRTFASMRLQISFLMNGTRRARVCRQGSGAPCLAPGLARSFSTNAGTTHAPSTRPSGIPLSVSASPNRGKTVATVPRMHALHLRSHPSVRNHWTCRVRFRDGVMPTCRLVREAWCLNGSWHKGRNCLDTLFPVLEQLALVGDVKYGALLSTLPSGGRSA